MHPYYPHPSAPLPHSLGGSAAVPTACMNKGGLRLLPRLVLPIQGCPPGPEVLQRAD